MAVPHVRRNRVDKSILDKLTDGFTGFADAVVQIAENAFDWGATEFTIRFYTDPKREISCVQFRDNGQGMDERGREAYTNLCDSAAREDDSKKGRNGTGRIGFINHAVECHTITKAADQTAFEIVLTKERMHDAWFERNTTLAWTAKKLSFDHLLKTSGTIVTWRDLTVGTKSQQAQRTAERLIEGLAEKLSPHIARKIRVETVDETGGVQTFELKPRELKGKPIEGRTTTPVKHLGDVEWNLYVVQQSDRSADFVMMGAMGPVCSWTTFARAFTHDPRYRTLAREIDIVLRHPYVVGSIDIPKANKFAVNSRKEFNANMLEDEHFCEALLKFLRLEIVPLVENELGMRSEEIVTTDDATLLADVCRNIHEATGEAPIKQKVIEIALNRHCVDLVPGRSYVFEIKDPRPGRPYHWDAKASGGSLDTNTGTRVTYTARDIGEGHTLRVSMMGDVKDAPSAIITINIFATIPMRFGKPTVRMGFHDRRFVRLNEVPAGADLVWTYQKWGGEIKISKDVTEAEILSSDKAGDFDITVVNKNNPSDTANCTIRIREQDEGESPKTGETTDRQFIVEDHLFELSSTTMRGTPDANAKTSWIERGDGYTIITLNLGHTLFDGYTDAVRRHAALREISQRVAHVLLDETQGPSTPDDMFKKAAQVSTVLMVKKS
ncbi:hypothetical protein A3C09_02465 [Candidatus Uhrbacteria bacterium RIFCSPHIGHO2_02_FULL_47_44]|uniref:Uncharacterized protein n=1 Tax=Candidatus Uhrbacteria bacterium RIFCSPLOWO2_02_FULL_48_18 TaxID=1802408 RepID=A0A1F7V7H1_9BACT|nr:MAG: hypothetical protein A2839_04305 [Candidatus Uhrbacteria bacterium RIFCSPHIGHO2_01_FULL_47_10]OGL71215.1 MAG: hypothetical protein A3C09_02465 [Candidatus Uhrbacteria bacterium RIFCSPHIGHO2_02_FULL_47_44]OGL80511.1 MAG: hypothetical protein A3B20_03850 [Candidatus Uhrbacteria bacterium RIFCSPLOWO2_01_FULL_47_17]OGL86371.1 MAG: hypothetical protein A3I41_02330 [Candidatus Uhrbacteria bacterium RIFCSPLOWO2_02_FULL_48_18]